MGGAVAGIGDVDNDGYADFAVGAPHACSSFSVGGAGSVTILSGRTGLAIRTIPGVESGDLFGQAIASINDIDGDGVADFVVGAPGVTVSGVGLSGAVLVYSGASGQLLFRIDGGTGNGFSGDRLGYAIAALGDIDHDGTPDFAVGAPGATDTTGTRTGSVLFVSGKGTILYRTYGGRDGGEYGFSLTSVSDVNSNGEPDLLIGAPGEPAGSATLYDPEQRSWIRDLSGDPIDCSFGSAGAALGDIDGDGVGEIAVGAPCSSSPINIAKVYVFSGSSGNQLFQIVGSGPGNPSGFGASLCAGDFDGDGETDLLVGAPMFSSPTGIFNGAVYLYTNLHAPPVFQLQSAANYDQLGQSVSSSPGLTGEGTDDFIVGSPGSEHSGVERIGLAFVYGRTEVRQARAFYPSTKPARRDANPPTVSIRLEPVGSDFHLADIQTESVALRPAAGEFREIRAVSVDLADSLDTDGNGVSEVPVSFTRNDWQEFFSELNLGTNEVSVDVVGALRIGRFKATTMLSIDVSTPPKAVLYPNPVRQRSTVTFWTASEGPASLELFDIGGRWIKTVLHTASLSPGHHDIVLDVSDQGGYLPSGMYFYRIESKDGDTVGKFVVVH